MEFIPLNGWPQLKDIPEKLEHFREVYARFAKVNRWYRSIEETEQTGNPVIFEKALKLNATALSVDMLPIQSGSGDPSPTNIRPISGRTAVNINHIRAICDFEQGTLSSAYGTKTDNNNRIRTKDLIPYAGGDIIIDIDNKQNTDILRAIFWYDSNKAYISNDAVFQSEFPYVFKEEYVPNNAAYIMLVVQSGDGSTNITPDGRAFDYMMLPIIIQLGQTVYGGTLDVKTGRLTIDTVYKKFTTDDTWTQGSTAGERKRFLHVLSPEIATPAAVPSIDGLYCSILKPQTADGGYICRYLTNSRFDVILPDSANVLTADEMKQWAATNELEIAYALATPTTVQLTGAELEMLIGYNYISTDADSLTVKAYTI